MPWSGVMQMAGSIAEAFLKELNEETVVTRKVLARVPETKFGWKPHTKSFAMGRLAGHVAEMVSWVSDVVTKDRLDIGDAHRPENSRFDPQSSAELLEKFDGWLEHSKKDLQSCTDEVMEQEWVMTWNGYEVVRTARRHAIRKLVLNHHIHHRAQLGVYLRLNDVPVPGAYGPSADEQ